MRSTGLRSPAGVQRARWWTFPTPQELPAFGVNLALTTQHALADGTAAGQSGVMRSGFGRPFPFRSERHLRRQQAGLSSRARRARSRNAS